LWNTNQIYKTVSITPIIPFNIYQTWHTKDLPPKLLEAANSIITNNPAFTYHLYDITDCSEFIKNNFNNDVFETYQRLIPYSYKSDLWKYCILYINGGVYLDMGFNNITSVNFVEFTDQEYFVKDLEEHGGGIYNGFIIVKPMNEILLHCILKIVENVKNKRFCSHPFEVTGSLLIKQFLTPEQITNLTINLVKHENNTIGINYKNNIILQR
jgi:mannosyltransferase OCH1-like enzyme